MCKIIIPLNGWAAGQRKFRFTAGSEFFQMFGNQEILDANVSVEVRVVKEGSQKVEADLHLSGSVTVQCDRCLESLVIPIEEAPEEAFKPGTVEVDWDLSQEVYDYICLAMPLQRVHPQGQCNPDTVRFLGQGERKNEEAGNENSPFAALKGLFEEK
ncbi:MAG: DUF177 domain-containing protein [Bacteroidales bacterium]|nr:DUF177 domain-containing protein [Bacteroidales bacterium]